MARYKKGEYTMRKLAMIVAIAVSAVAGAANICESTPPGWTDDYCSALRRAKAEGKHVLAVFSGSDWCCWCKRFDSEILCTDEFIAYATDNFVLLFVDFPKDRSLVTDRVRVQNKGLARTYRVNSYPTVVVLDAAGCAIHKTGYKELAPRDYVTMLNKAVSRYYDGGR